MNKPIFTLVLASSVSMMASHAYAVPFGGVEFPDGARSFADTVISYSEGDGVGSGWRDPSAALGAPDGEDVSLGKGGSLILQFTDNSLTTSGDGSEDLWIFEVGPAVEAFNVGISTDNTSWIDLGDVSGQPTGIDIDSLAGVVSGAFYSFVRLTDVSPDESGFPFAEADIDAVGAISSADPVEIPVPVPEPGTLALLGMGLAGLGLARRKN
ncbi:MAG: PEP-CTERM sorting domain-containing protein [Marinobacter sp.]|uniref:PEP-CTERM sorting domain-containing protein n=1 Tax=Marinobacter sp. TaxID=50741 RepID=UPI00299D2EDE|nr:PEP-CTERM sorting domain-containing protein [Marinobacter sp.]MDX1633784.1 PEP-CTERM sorting domain-containing protein [Marinobacter sp.]